jgi:hypothetical protein
VKYTLAAFAVIRLGPDGDVASTNVGQLTEMLATSAVALPDPAATVQFCAGAEGWVITLTR